MINKELRETWYDFIILTINEDNFAWLDSDLTPCINFRYLGKSRIF